MNKLSLQLATSWAFSYVVWARHYSHAVIMTVIGMLHLMPIQGQVIQMYPMYHSIGYEIYDNFSIDSCKVEFKAIHSDQWLNGLNPDKVYWIDDYRWIGSVFPLGENETYEFKVTIFRGSQAVTLPIYQAKTLHLPKLVSNQEIKWVSPNGRGNYTKEDPGNLKDLFASGSVECGTTIFLTNGIYRDYNLVLHLTKDCSTEQPIIIKAAPDAKPIIDGSIQVETEWTAHSGINGMYYTSAPPNASHSSICLLGDRVLYPYPTIFGNILFGFYNLSELNLDHDGFVRDENQIWIKTQDNIDPNQVPVYVSQAFNFLTVYGNGFNANIHIIGLEFYHFSKPKLNPPGSPIDYFPARVFDFRNIHHIYIDSCHFNLNTLSVVFSDSCSKSLIQNCRFTHQAGNWSHAMLKKSQNYLSSPWWIISSSRARNIETPSILLENFTEITLRQNQFIGVNSALESILPSGRVKEIEVYQNLFLNNFDAIECDGLWSNLRIWENEFYHAMAAISAAPPLIGPRYIYRNIVHGLKGRKNKPDDVLFFECDPIVSEFFSEAAAIKTNSGELRHPLAGPMYVFNNTIYSEDSLGFAAHFWLSEWSKALWVNNILAKKSQPVLFFADLGNTQLNNTFQLTSIRDNFYIYNAETPIITVRKNNSQFQCEEIYNADDIEPKLRYISTSPYIVVTEPFQIDPKFDFIGSDGFHLTANSPMIDAGVIIPGFYDFKGAYPDLGAKEYNGISHTEKTILKSLNCTVYPNPSKGQYIQFNFNETINCLGAFILNPQGQLIAHLQGFKSNTWNLDAKDISPGFYIIIFQIPDGMIQAKVMILH